MSTDLPVLEAKDFASDQDVRWCPGCGDYSILAQMKKMLPSLGVPRENLVFISGMSAVADEQTDFFERNIRPVLVEHCYECHAEDSDDVGGNLLLDSRAGWMTGGVKLALRCSRWPPRWPPCGR